MYKIYTTTSDKPFVTSYKIIIPRTSSRTKLLFLLEFYIRSLRHGHDTESRRSGTPAEAAPRGKRGKGNSPR